ncbi:MAG: tetratricopeptide repeat protein [Planctomycetes bacterium]|nr:tetratricopeptide repeat protein [Planctomycetota bacterium]
MPDLHVEPYRSLVRAGLFADASSAAAREPEELYARAHARTMAGREAEARSDFEACLPALGDRARIELALLDIRQRSALPAARDTAERIADLAPPGAWIAARARHVLGLAEGKLRRTSASLEALLSALDLYRAAGDRQGAAEVHDTLGSVFAAQGRIEVGVNHYALSLVGKNRTGDRYGTAVTLGNLGRLHLRAGRAGDAIECFELDLELARELGDERGVARMHEDLGRAYHLLEDGGRARAALERALEHARAHGFGDVEFFALVDLARVQMADEDLDPAASSLARAKSLLGDGEPYLRTLFASVQGELAFRRGEPGALEALTGVAREFEAADLPDLEIPFLIALAGAFAETGLKENAEACLRRAGKRARSDGYARYLPRIREAMAQLDLVESTVEERGRFALTPEASADLARAGGGTADGYVRVRSLGKGAFGEVFRAYDPLRGHDVAIKRLALDGVYDLDRRRRMITSARLELEAVSRLRHPGIARVHAFGTDAEGATYVVQGSSTASRSARGSRAVRSQRPSTW